MKPDWLTLRMYRIDTIMKRYVDEIEFVAGLIALSMFLLMLGGCGAVSRVVILQNPATKQTVECKVDPLGDMRRTKQIKDCVKAYEQAGYGVVGDSDK